MRALQLRSGVDLAEGDEGRTAVDLESAESLVEVAELMVHEEQWRLDRAGADGIRQPLELGCGDEESSLGVALDEPSDERLDVALVALVLEVRVGVLERRDSAMRLPESHLERLAAQIAQNVVASEELVDVGQVQLFLRERDEL